MVDRRPLSSKELTKSTLNFPKPTEKRRIFCFTSISFSNLLFSSIDKRRSCNTEYPQLNSKSTSIKMRLQAVPLPSLVAFFWPLALSAVPGATAQGAASLIAKDASSENLGLIKRANVDCYIVNSNSPSVNCRSGPGFGYSVVAAASVGMVYNFDCYETGDCYEDNWYVPDPPLPDLVKQTNKIP